MAVEVRNDFGGVFLISVSVNPASLGAGTVANTTVAHADIRANDLVVPIPPPALEAGVVIQGCHSVQNGQFSLRLYNPTAGAVDPAAATWQFLVFRR
jgi:hypothetical protein